MAITPIISINDLSFRFGQEYLFQNVDTHIYLGDRICLIGRNGVGKSTFLKILTSELEYDSGRIHYASGHHILYLKQTLPDFKSQTAEEFLHREVPHFEDYQFDQYKKLFTNDLSIKCKKLSGGEQKKLQIISLLLKEPDILLLDEPTNHLDLAAIITLEQILKSFRGTVVLISHDRRFLETVTNKVLWIEDQQLIGFDQGFAQFEKWQDQIIQEKENMKGKLAQKLKAETRWLLKGVTARRKRNQRRLKELCALRESKQKLDLCQNNKFIDTVDFQKQRATSYRIFEIENLCKAYKQNKIIEDFSARIIKGNKIGLIGPNGSGKTTFIQLLLGKITADSGHIISSDSLKINYIDQHLSDIHDEDTLAEVLCGKDGQYVFVQGEYIHVASYLERFLFSSQDMHSPVKRLSGGEKRRLKLAKALANPSDVLILDEPTNDLDVETLDMLKEILSTYEGTILLVSHDRDFLESIVTSLLVFSKTKGQIQHFAGNVDDWSVFIEEEGDSPLKSCRQNIEKKGDTPKKNIQKLTFNETRLLSTLPDKILELEKAIDALSILLNDQYLATNNHEKYIEMSSQFEALNIQKTNCEEQWLSILEKEEALKK